MVRLTGGRALGAALLACALVACGSGGDGDSGGTDGAAEEREAQELWRPAPGTPWQWQLGGTLDLTVDVPVYDVDGFETTAAQVAELHARDVRVICYVNAGAWEEFRPDADAFPPELLGEGNGWPGERWLDIRELDALRPLLAARFDMCAEKGFDAVEPDLLEGFTNDTGFPLTAADQLAFNRMVASLAHDRGLAVGLKNDGAQAAELVDDFDFAVSEECAAFGECELLLPFVEQGKAVLHVEYDLAADEFCAETTALGFSSMVKRLELDAWREPCPS
ncbi:endo alpha-1,4 polygalactosaminidase [Streptomyces avicenniae]|uniref:endo alpha-1,4 polygalactosaminidase n=1 Tax=Streptomyces avicenniae TaxID=500153 RepID=UPI000AAC18F1|nr:endo alpha-1,4 polygalactosaminidase [Streptomyces avicenniae]